MADAPASRKPEDSAIKQQRLKAWQPILTPAWVIGTFLLVGIVFVPLGSHLKDKSDEVVEYRHAYDGKNADATLKTTCGITEKNAELEGCQVTFTLKEDMDAPVFVYYELNNFYQNHRRYVKSLDVEQLMGDTSDPPTAGQCDPLSKEADCYGDDMDQDCHLNPCGLIANSLFNDVISEPTVTRGSDAVDIDWSESGIAWDSDVDKKFANVQEGSMTYDDGGCDCAAQPAALGGDCCDDLASCSWNTDGTAGEGIDNWCDVHYPNDIMDPYKNSAKDLNPCYLGYEGGEECSQPTKYLYSTYPNIISKSEGVKNEHFIVWMRTAGLPDFRKLYAKINTDLKKGDVLEFDITANFEVASFDGTKALVISTTSWFGGKNPFLGIAYITVGSICLALGVAFLVKHLQSPRKLGDTKYLVWSKSN